MSAPVLSCTDVTKRFGGLVAVNAVNLEVRPGEVVALVGDNGAGKSTLVQMISGVFRPDGGQILLHGEVASFATPMEARGAGIETIYQDLALCENLGAAANIFLGREKRRRRWGVLEELDEPWMRAEAQRVLDELDVHLGDLDRPVRQLSGGQRQAVAIARAVYWRARLMIMDEPTAALGVPEQRKVLDLVRTLKARGTPVVIISHNMTDVFAVADRLLVLRRGRKVGDLAVADTDHNAVVALMIGG